MRAALLALAPLALAACADPYTAPPLAGETMAIVSVVPQTQSPDLMARLTAAQDHRALLHIDIMTFAGLCDSEDELRTHVEYYEGRVAKAEGR